MGDPPEATSSNIFREISHWHNSRRPIDPKIREDQIAKSEKRMFFARRRNQFFMAEMTAYAASLTNAVGKVLDPEIITSGAKSEKREESPKPKANAKSNKKGGPTKKEAMLAKIAADKSRKDEATSENFLQSWRSTCKFRVTDILPSACSLSKSLWLLSVHTNMHYRQYDRERTNCGGTL